MSLAQVMVIEGVFSDGQKARMIAGVTHAAVAVEGESLQPVTWVRCQRGER